MAIDYQVLATELALPAYADDVVAARDQTLADRLNAVQGGITLKRQDVSARELYEAILVSDYAALSGNPTAAQLSTERRYLAWLTGLLALDRVRLQNEDNSLTPVGANLDAMFPASPGSPTRTRIIALMTRNGSRAEQMFGIGTVLSHMDIARALGRG